MKTHRDNPIYDMNLTPRHNNVCNENWIYCEIASSNNSNTKDDDSYDDYRKLYFDELNFYCDKQDKIRLGIITDRHSYNDSAILGNIGLNC